MSLHQMEQARITTSTGTERFIRDVRMMPSFGRWVQLDTTRRSDPYARNANTISIELCCKCDGDSTSADDQKWYFTEETQEACVWLVKKLRKELGIPAENVLRHYDIVNKVCPAPYVHNNKYRTSWTWSEFKRRISDTSDSDGTKQNAGSNKTDGASNTSQKMRYVVQCGAFAEKKNAEAMVRQLQEKGFTAIVKTA